MLSNYLKIALRNLNRNRAHTIINVFGLALGIASMLLISFYLTFELGYDRHVPGYENVYRIVWVNENPQTRTPHPMAQAVVQDFPEVESAVTLSPLWAAGLTREIFSFRNLDQDQRYDEKGVLAVDSTFFDVFPTPVTRGDGPKALRSINGLLISESMAKKYFGDKDPIGKQLAVNSDTTLLEVMAVFKDVPAQSHFHYDFLVSYVREKSFDGDEEYYSWADFGHFNYLRLRPGADVKALESKLMTWSGKYIQYPQGEFESLVRRGYGFKLQPIADIHLQSHLRWELEPTGNMEYIYIMGAAALLTLVIACINFMNLMTARSAERAKEIGIRKTLGALRRQLSFQFLTESVLTTLMAIGVAVFLVEASLPFYEILTSQTVSLDYRQAVPVLLGLCLLIGLGAGLYPSLLLSAVKPQEILKGRFHHGATGSGLRKGLIVFQFAISMVLMSATIVIFSQLDFLQNKSLGFDKEQVIVVPLKNGGLSRRMPALKTELAKIPGVAAVSASSNLPGGQYNQNSVYSTTVADLDIDCSEAFVDSDFLNAMNMEMASGRFFRPDSRADSGVTFVINETAARQLQMDDAVGKDIRWEAYDTLITGKVIGVMKDFHFESFHDPLRPLLFVSYPAYNYVVIRLKAGEPSPALNAVKATFAQFDNLFEFEYSFLDDRLNRQYSSEQRTGVIFSVFAGLAMLIACSGLLGIAMLSFSQRMKELSIRKVLGASVYGLVVMLLGDFTRMIVLAIAVATPLAWWMMDSWLHNFVYRVGINPFIFLVSGAVLVAISWGTLGYFTVKTSRVNPTETLKGD